MIGDMPKDTDFYSKYIMEIPIYFPNGKETCQYCPFSRADRELKRFYCIVTNYFLYNPFSERGYKCPLRKENEE